ncbi:unnamed protein product [Nippostrongylus brasiliensis]|uniref:Acyl_transf_3 domain-containing protein n=1 Tax=Nippostrongylus brasiliensis TaxID=27835 RepID=A0A0N4XZN4_NIPBR|nr:unnamed protein product [Nippostrongylus brasiliensis]
MQFYLVVPLLTAFRRKSSSTIHTTCLLIIGKYEHKFQIPNQHRLATTITTAVVVAFGSNFLSSRCLVHFGDISYTLYLVHWPIFCWLKLNDHINRYGWLFGPDY